jgi:hypothetical protein
LFRLPLLQVAKARLALPQKPGWQSDPLHFLILRPCVCSTCCDAWTLNPGPNFSPLQVDEALAVLQDMAGRGAERSPVAYGALVAAAEKAARPALALQLFDDMLRALLKPSAATFAAALAACAQSANPGCELSWDISKLDNGSHPRCCCCCWCWSSSLPWCSCIISSTWQHARAGVLQRSTWHMAAVSHAGAGVR